MLGCVGCYKDLDDPRELVPLDPSRPWSDYLVQHLQGDEVMVKFPEKVLTQPSHDADVALANNEEVQTFGKISPTSSLANPEELEGLVKSLSVARATGYETWRDVGFALKNVVGLGVEGL